MSFSRIKRACAVALFCLTLSATGINAQQKRTKGCLTECQPRMGIVSAFGGEAEVLLAETSNKQEYVINGNLYTTGILRGNSVVIVLTGISIQNATMVTQLTIDHFNIHHLLLSGIAGGVNPDYKVGDVLIPKRWAQPLEVYWSANSAVPAPCEKPRDLSCLGLKLSRFTSQPNSDFQIPTPNGPVGTGLFMRDTFVLNNSNFPNGEFKFDYVVDPEMFAVAQSIAVPLDRCGPKNPSLCMSVQPKIRRGGRGISGPMFLANPDYRRYVFNTIRAVSVDMETPAFAHVAYANEIPFIAFRSLSDLAGGDDFTNVSALFASGLAESNSSRVTLGFLEAWSQKHPE